MMKSFNIFFNNKFDGVLFVNKNNQAKELDEFKIRFKSVYKNAVVKILNNAILINL